jgi:hypothetical protein
MKPARREYQRGRYYDPDRQRVEPRPCAGGLSEDAAMAALRCTCPPCLVCSLQHARARLHNGQLELADDIPFQLVTELRTYNCEPCRAATGPWQQISELEEIVHECRG